MFKKTNLKFDCVVIISLIFIFGQIAFGQDIIYVDSFAPPGGDGSDWMMAYKYLQDALADANSSGDVNEIRVAQGVYRPDETTLDPNGTGDREASFQLINGVTLVGGYAGVNEPDPNARDFDLYETILDGDLAGNDVSVDDICDLLNHPSRVENSFHVVTSSNAGPNTILDGFTITRGNANGSYPHLNGGGMYNDSSSPGVLNCTFCKNSGGSWAGGMLNYKESAPIVVSCAFRENFAFMGGGMVNDSGSPIIASCTFSGNSAEGSGGGMCNYEGSNITLTNCTFSSNWASAIGGGMYNDEDSNITLTNCTFTGNMAGLRGGGIYKDTYMTMTNCILWGNNPDEIYNSYSGTYNVTYSDVQGGCPGEGNIDANPNFVREPCPGPDGKWNGIGDDFGDLHFTCGSPCLDAGTNTTLPPLPATDLDGTPRIVNGIVDMGAYEGANQAFLVVSGPVIIPEGTTGTFTVALACEPSEPVDVSVEYDTGDMDITVQAGALLTFDSTNFWDPQIVVLAAAEDVDQAEGTTRFHVSAADISFNSILASEVENDVGPIIFVDAGASGAGNGTSWTDALRNLSDAIVLAQGASQAVEEIWVAAGTYKADPAGLDDPRDATFKLLNDLNIYGGFPLMGGNWEDRDPDLYQTILSGDLHGNDVLVSDPCELLYEPSRADNCYHVVTASETNATAVLDGFIITGGNASATDTEPSEPKNDGAGMYNVAGNPTINKCTFRENSAADDGAGMYNDSVSGPTVTNCTFSSNWASWGGGGIDNWHGSSLTLTNCLFQRNSAGLEGGGMRINESSATITNCTFSRNSSNKGGAIYSFVMHRPTTPNLTAINSTFSKNVARYGGGIYNRNCNMALSRCVLGGNSAVLGGGMYTQGSTKSMLINCTLSQNTGGGIYNIGFVGVDGLTVINSIIWPDQIIIDSFFITVNYSDIVGDWLGEGNIDADPCFVDPCNPDPNLWNLRLSAGSPCIDTGDPNYYDSNYPTDLDGRDRYVDGDCNDTEIVDMGAYEFTFAYYGDFDGSCDVDFIDYSILAIYWLTDEFLVDIAPTPAGDGVIDKRDLEILCDHWLETWPPVY